MCSLMKKISSRLACNIFNEYILKCCNFSLLSFIVPLLDILKQEYITDKLILKSPRELFYEKRVTLFDGSRFCTNIVFMFCII